MAPKAKQVGIESRRKVQNNRFYEILPGDPYPSITTILQILNKPALGPWFAKVEREACIAAAIAFYFDGHASGCESREAFAAALQAFIGKQKAANKISAAACEIGNESHGTIEWKARKHMGLSVGPEPKISDAAQWAVMAYEDWAKAHDFKPSLSECVVYSHHHRYAGTLDLYGTVDGIPTLVDIKTGKAIYAEAKMQCAAYVEAAREMGLFNSRRAIVLRLPKIESDPEFEAVEVTDLGYHFESFLHAAALWRWNYEQEQAYRESQEVA